MDPTRSTMKELLVTALQHNRRTGIGHVTTLLEKLFVGESLTDPDWAQLRRWNVHAALQLRPLTDDEHRQLLDSYTEAEKTLVCPRCTGLLKHDVRRGIAEYHCDGELGGCGYRFT